MTDTPQPSPKEYDILFARLAEAAYELCNQFKKDYGEVPVDIHNFYKETYRIWREVRDAFDKTQQRDSP